ncbi:MAG TPA: cytochrome c [Thiotrichales bacterium]|nr:cytochrome c [Thiotrichales bacterium]
MAMALCGAFHTATAAADETTAAVTGENIFLGRCGTCHELPDPDALTPMQWRAVLKKMQKRMKFLGVPPLSDEENEKVYDWLSK